MQTDDWHGCYSEGWTGEIVEAAFSHPAKYSRGLIKRIYQHIIDEDWAQPGDTILDPFGGVALGGLDAMRHGLSWVGVELEPKFVELGQQNIELWQRKYADRVEMWGLDSWGTAAILQGDSRRLCEVLAGAGGVISSPPFADNNVNIGAVGNTPAMRQQIHDSRKRDESYGSTPGQLGNLPATDAQFEAVIGSPPYATGQMGGGGHDLNSRNQEAMKEGYGETDGQLGAMPEGSHAAVVSSPPYTESIASDDPDKRGGLFRDPKRRNDKTLTAEYGESEGQLGRMSVVSSPPFESNQTKAGGEQGKGWYSGQDLSQGMNRLKDDYAELGPGNIGNTTGQDFWTAARQIMEQVAMVLPPGAHAVWVCKRFVRGREVINFSQQWADLCEACGFKVIHWHRAWLIEERGKQYTLDGGLEEKQVKRCSFFRRLYEGKYPENAIDWEDVICMARV